MGRSPGAQAEYLRVPHVDYGPIKVPQGPADDRFVYLSDVLPTAWQAFQYASVPKGGTLMVIGLGPIGDMTCRIALQHGVSNVIGVDLVAERLERARGNGVTTAFQMAIDAVRRGGTISLVGVYGGMADPLPMLTMFDKQIQLRMGQANVRRWVDEILPLVLDDADPLGTESFAAHHVSLDEAPKAYAAFQKKQDGAVKYLFRP